LVLIEGYDVVALADAQHGSICAEARNIDANMDWRSEIEG
jgi:hypothetical protein